MKKVIVGLIALMVASVASAQSTRQTAVTLIANYNVAAVSPTYTYPFFRGPDAGAADPLGEGVKPIAKVKTVAGGGTTVSAFTAGTNPFLGLVAGDLLCFPNAPTVVNTGATGVNIQGATQKQCRVITTATDNDNAVVNASIDLSQDSTGYVVYWKKFKTGTGSTDGWFSVANFTGFQIVEQATTLTGTSLEFSLQCRYLQTPNSQPNQVDLYSFTSASFPNAVHSVYVNVPYDQCRIGVGVTGDAGTQSIWAYIIGEKMNGR